jgi:hypothetical protein
MDSRVPFHWGTILERCEFQLRSFHSTFPLDRAFVSFFEKQPKIQQLIDESTLEHSASLPSTILPDLVLVRVKYVPRNVLAIATGRNITHLDCYEVPFPLDFSTVLSSIKALAVHLVDPTRPLLMPELEILTGYDIKTGEVRRCLCVFAFSKLITVPESFFELMDNVALQPS